MNYVCVRENFMIQKYPFLYYIEIKCFYFDLLVPTLFPMLQKALLKT